MRHSQVHRHPGVAIMFVASLMLAGAGVLLSAGGPATAAPEGTNVCSSLTATINYSAVVPTATGMLSGCHQQGSGVWSVLGVPFSGPYLGSISWQSGRATSDIVLTLKSIDFHGGPCPAGDNASYYTLTVSSGPYEGSTAPLVECGNTSQFPAVTLTNFGPVTI
jgi:hypothetical protein